MSTIAAKARHKRYRATHARLRVDVPTADLAELRRRLPRRGDISRAVRRALLALLRNLRERDAARDAAAQGLV